MKNGESFEYVIVDDKENVLTFENQNVSQTLIDSDNQDAPVLNVDVKSKRIPTYTLEITKLDAETHEPLSGAQYGIQGPGLARGKFITTDENGKASVELYLKVPYNLNGFDFTQYSSQYKLSETSAPIGYTLDNNIEIFEEAVSLNANDCSSNLDECIKNGAHYIVGNNKIIKDSEWDSETNTLKITVYDYPLIRITKTDAETGELLPNTLFTIEKLTSIGGISVYTPATDLNGNVIGDVVVIDDVEYNVVATNENGQLSMPLSAGKYRLKEVQAADDKYEVDTAVYYFGVGETIGYQSDSLEYVGDISPNGFDPSPYNEYHRFLATDDGGWISTAADGKVTKYNVDGEIEWSKFYTILTANNYNVATYFDKPGYYFEAPSDGNIGASARSLRVASIVKSSDGGYFVDTTYPRHVILKLDKDGNVIWQNEAFSNYIYYQYHYVDYCSYDGNSKTDDSGNTLIRYCYVSNGETDCDLGDTYTKIQPYQIRDDETYYCKIKSQYQFFNGATEDGKIASTGDGGVMRLSYLNYDNRVYLSTDPVTLVEFDTNNSL